MKRIITTLVVVGAVALGASACGDLESGNHPYQAKSQGGHHATDNGAAGGSGKPVDSLTPAQENAVGAAQDYLDYSGFSKTGLIQQLSSKAGDGFKLKDATFAVNHIKVDWNKQAVRSAKQYLDFTHFSRQGLIDQLTSKAGDGYTVAQATYAANHVGL